MEVYNFLTLRWRHTFTGKKRQEHTAIAGFRLEPLAAALAVVEKPAGVSRHGLGGEVLGRSSGADLGRRTWRRYCCAALDYCPPVIALSPIPLLDMGSLILNAAPPWTGFLADIAPWCASIMVRAMDNPMPMPSALPGSRQWGHSLPYRPWRSQRLYGSMHAQEMKVVMRGADKEDRAAAA